MGQCARQRQGRRKEPQSPKDKPRRDKAKNIVCNRRSFVFRLALDDGLDDRFDVQECRGGASNLDTNSNYVLECMLYVA